MRRFVTTLTTVLVVAYPILVWVGRSRIIVLGDRRFLLAGPVLVNGVLLLRFGGSLFGGRMPTVERFARAHLKDLSPERVSYCRAVTNVWCAFFLLNGCISLGLALYGSLAAWGVYTGALAYVAMGLLFAGEYVVRRIRFG